MPYKPQILGLDYYEIGGGDMLKSVYDKNNNGIVDLAEGIELEGKVFNWRIDEFGIPYLEEAA